MRNLQGLGWCDSFRVDLLEESWCRVEVDGGEEHEGWHCRSADSSWYVCWIKLRITNRYAEVLTKQLEVVTLLVPCMDHRPWLWWNSKLGDAGTAPVFQSFQSNSTPREISLAQLNNKKISRWVVQSHNNGGRDIYFGTRKSTEKF